MKLLSHILVLVIFSSCVTSINGKYSTVNDEFGVNSTMKIKNSNRFTISYSIGLRKGESFGTWTLKGDTLILNTSAKSDSLPNQMSNLKNEKWIIDESKIFWTKMGDKMYDSTYYYLKR